MKELIYLSMAPATENNDQIISVLGQEIHIKQIGIDFNLPLLKDLIAHYSGKVDTIAVSGLPGPVKIGRHTVIHPIQEELKILASPTPLVDGSTLRHILIPWALNQFLKNNPQLFRNKKTCALCRRLLLDLAVNLEEEMKFCRSHYKKNEVKD